jgi:cytochrome c2
MMIRLMSSLCLMLVLAACGSIATPVYEALPTNTPFIAENASSQGESVAVVPTETPLPPTATPVPPTVAPTEMPTEAPTQAAAAVDDPLKFFVDLANPGNGEALFKQMWDLPDGSQWACNTCHLLSEVQAVGPGMAGIAARAATRVPGEGAYTYLYNSIHNSALYIVPGFEAQVQQMPHFGPGANGEPAVLSDAQIYDLVAYLMTFE